MRNARFHKAHGSYFYPRPPGGGRPVLSRLSPTVPGYFYPRPPGGGRPVTMLYALADQIFLSTPSGWRATFDGILCLISSNNFYPRPPGGGRHGLCNSGAVRLVISIHALRVEGDCRCLPLHPKSPAISIHALRVEGDRNQRLYQRKQRDFYPRPPGGGRLITNVAGNRRAEISIHALRVEGDLRCPRVRCLP